MIQHKLSKILEEQRKQNAFVGELQHSDNEKIPTAVHKNYDVRIIFGKGSKIHPLAISELNSQNIGSLVALKAMVVRTGEVQPLLAVATYACDLCGC